jgi:hypothetical protein
VDAVGARNQGDFDPLVHDDSNLRRSRGGNHQVQELQEFKRSKFWFPDLNHISAPLNT